MKRFLSQTCLRVCVCLKHKVDKYNIQTRFSFFFNLNYHRIRAHISADKPPQHIIIHQWKLIVFYMGDGTIWCLWNSWKVNTKISANANGNIFLNINLITCNFWYIHIFLDISDIIHIQVYAFHSNKYTVTHFDYHLFCNIIFMGLRTVQYKNLKKII